MSLNKERKLITNKEYPFKTLKEIMEFVTIDNVDDFLIDFAQMLIGAVSYREQALQFMQKIYDDTPAKERLVLEKEIDIISTRENLTKMCNDIQFSWIDDGKHDYENTSEFELQINNK